MEAYSSEHVLASPTDLKEASQTTACKYPQSKTATLEVGGRVFTCSCTGYSNCLFLILSETQGSLAVLMECVCEHPTAEPDLISVHTVLGHRAPEYVKVIADQVARQIFADVIIGPSHSLDPLPSSGSLKTLLLGLSLKEELSYDAFQELMQLCFKTLGLDVLRSCAAL